MCRFLVFLRFKIPLSLETPRKSLSIMIKTNMCRFLVFLRFKIFEIHPSKEAASNSEDKRVLIFNFLTFQNSFIIENPSLERALQ